MPSLGADMDQGTVVEWLVRPGDTVHKGDIMAVVDTTKAAVEVECFTAGVVQELLVEPGRTVPVGTVLATLAPAESAAEPEPTAQAVPEPRPATQKPAARKPAAAGPQVRKLAAELGVDLATVRGSGKAGAITRADIQQAAERKSKPVPTSGRTKVSPYARRLADELGVDLATITPGGRDGAVHAADIRATAGRPETPRRPQPKRDRVEAMRATTAGLMARSKREIPHYYLTTSVDMFIALEWSHKRNRELPVPDRILPAALLLKATALAAKAVPGFNGHWIDDRFESASTVHLGIAVAMRGGGLAAPAILDASELDLTTLMARLRDLVKRARAGRLRRTEMTSATITVTNLGDLGVDTVHGVIYPPQVALVGFGKVLERPWAVDGLLGVRPIVTATLSADHRVTDGHSGARFLDVLSGRLREPETL